MVIPLIFPKVPQSSLDILWVPQLPPSPWTLHLKNPIRFISGKWPMFLDANDYNQQNSSLSFRFRKTFKKGRPNLYLKSPSKKGSDLELSKGF